MSGFQWNDSHIDLFIKKFKGQSEDIKTEDVRDKRLRKSGEPKMEAQDYRNLMRLVVRSGCARVVDGYFTSKKYRIRLVSDENPYDQEVFDVELFYFLAPKDLVPNYQTFRALFPEVSEQEWNSPPYLEALQNMNCKALSLFSAFYACNYHGGDLSINVFEEFDANRKELNKTADYFQLEVKSFILQYKALKTVSSELKRMLLEDCPSGSGFHLFEGQDHLLVFEHAYNYYFYKIVQANLIWDFWRHIGMPGKRNRQARSTELKAWHEIISIPGSTRKIDISGYSQEFLDVQMFYTLVDDLLCVANRPEVIEAVKNWRVVLYELRSLECSFETGSFS